ncbi:uncharacterized protein PRCAT00005169001 [Priceomyces carsonii]|uniref:uncharacterized protein n=1 Tax=Priceomyces carsonii TaxID=28549 RepID=UPI002ED9672E|nr:unnamed protein product [Priceomyces carsonii]
MALVNKRYFSQCWRVYEGHVPRFAKTILAASKAPLTKPRTITRPFGYQSPVLLNHRTADVFSIGWLIRELFGLEAKERRQKKLDHEISHSPFYESKSFLNTNGKIFTPPVSYFKQERAQYFPEFISATLLKKHQSLYELLENKVSVLRIYSTYSGDKCSRTYFETKDGNYLNEKYDKFLSMYPSAQIIDVNVPQSWIKGFLVKIFVGRIKKAVNRERYRKYMILPEHIFSYDVRSKLLCDNMCSGYVYVLDNEGKIRWATSGNADEAEKKQLWKCVLGLEKELSKTLPQKMEKTTE